MANKMVSVIVPLYNAQDYIDDCIESMRTQTYAEWELIIIDDGSDDKSYNQAAKSIDGDPRMRLYRISHAGLSAARNTGIRYASGDYLMFLDSDDRLFPYSIELLVRQLDDYDAELVQGMTIESEKYYIPAYNHSKIISYSSIKAVADTLYQKNLSPSACGNLYKRSLFDKLRFKDGIYYEDLDLFYKIFLECKSIIFLKTPVYFYRINRKSITHSWNHKRLDVLQVTKDIEHYMKEYYPELVLAAQDRRLSANFNMYSLCMIHGDKENARKCWIYIRKYRLKSLFNINVRLKNKCGILLSYLGENIFNFFARTIYKG